MLRTERSPVEKVVLGPTPPGEECAQLGSPGYHELARAECSRYKDLIVRVFGPPPAGATLVTVGNSHDFGTYYEVAVQYRADDAEAEAYALAVDNEGPSAWDDDAPRDWRTFLLGRAP
jgi:hypothetical protein